MTLKTALSAAAFALLATTVSAENRDVAIDIIQNGIIGGDRAVIEAHVAENIIPHNPNAAPGRAGVLGYAHFLSTLDAPVPSQVVRVLSEGDLVVMQREVDFFGPHVLFDLLRFE